MTEAKKLGSRGALSVLAVTGVLTLLLSLATWGSCPTTPCGGILMAISEYSGLDLGFGLVTGLAGLALAAIGLAGLRRIHLSRLATAAMLVALLIVATAGVSVIWMYVIPGDDKEYYWPPYTAIHVVIVGVIAFAAGLRLKQTIAESGG
jgi:hypothetical protein